MVLRVLIADDDPDDAELVALALSRAGIAHVWERVETEPAFIAAISNADLVICDHSMPRFSPDRALDLVGSVPLILISGNISPDRVTELLTRGARTFVPKERLRDLAASIRTLF